MTALADRVRFRQIMENLLSNAIKFTPEGGRIAVTVDRDRRPRVGRGSPTPASASRRPTTAGSSRSSSRSATRPAAAGTGLGLALTRRLVEAHDGEITLVSALGPGSAFTVRLPGRAPRSGHPSRYRRGRARRVLLIEDDPQSAELLRTQLAHAGYGSTWPAPARPGLSSAGAHPPDAIVLDVTLPGIDGWEVIRRLKADDRLAGIPVFFVTHRRRAPGRAGPRRRRLLREAGRSGRAARARWPGPSPPGPARAVLVVDHDDAVRRAIEEGLRAGGADVVACADGRDGPGAEPARPLRPDRLRHAGHRRGRLQPAGRDRARPGHPAHPGARPDRGRGRRPGRRGPAGRHRDGRRRAGGGDGRRRRLGGLGPTAGRGARHRRRKDNP